MTLAQRITIALELLGGPKYAAEVRKSAAATLGLGRASEVAAEKTGVLTARTWLQNQALFTLRRYAFYGTLAITALGLAIVKWGASYLSALQNARVALTPVVKDQGVLNSYLEQLFQISKFSPFVIKDIAIAFRTMFAQMSAVGISGQKVLTIIRAITNYLSYTGHTTPANLERVSQGLAKMANMGRLTGLTIRSLAAGGLPIYTILNKKLGVTRDQLSNIAKLNLPTDSVLNAILSYAKETPGVRGAAARISLGTFSGLLQVTRDTLSQISGHLISGTFSGGQSWLGRLVKPGGPLDRISKIKTPGGTYNAILKTIGAGAGVRLILDIFFRLGQILVKIIIPAFVVALHGLTLFYPILKPLDWILKQITKHTTLFRIVMAVLATEFIITHGAMLLVEGSMIALNILTLGNTRLIGKLAVMLFTRLIPAMWALAVAVAANPLFWIPALIVAIVAGLVILYYKWKPFRDLVNNTFNYIKNASPGIKLALAIAFGPLAIAVAQIILLIKYWGKLKNAVKNDAHKLAKASKGNSFLGMPVWTPHAVGGITGSGISLVGERGPELAMFPSGTQIIPNNQLSSSLSLSSAVAGSNDGAPIIVQVMLDRKVLAEGVARANQDRRARK